VAKFKERRASPKAARVSGATEKPAADKAAAAPGMRDAAGFHTMDAVREFIQYDLDGGAQTEWNERFVMPLCMAVIGVDSLATLPNEGARNRHLAAVGDALRKVTRRSDRVARVEDDYIVLLRRTLAKRAHDFYVANVRKTLADCGVEATVSFGITSLTEHMVTGAEDMIKKAYTALQAARKQGPGSVVVYDFRTMAY